MKSDGYQSKKKKKKGEAEYYVIAPYSIGHSFFEKKPRTSLAAGVNQ
jgi:hypothetical protein